MNTHVQVGTKSEVCFNYVFFFSNRYIVDSGFVKQLNHNSRVGMDILEVVPISKYVSCAVPPVAMTHDWITFSTAFC